MRIAAAILALSLAPAAAQDMRMVESIGSNMRLALPDDLPAVERQRAIAAAVTLYRNNVCDRPGRSGDFERFGSAVSSATGSSPHLPFQQGVIRAIAVLVASGNRQAVCGIIDHL